MEPVDWAALGTIEVPVPPARGDSGPYWRSRTDLAS